MSLDELIIDPSGIERERTRYQILALSGGGYRGLFSARVLERLEEETGRPVVDSFDLVAGTSVGGLIAIGLACGVSAAKIRRTIEEKGREIFPWHGSLRMAVGARYSPQALGATVRAILPTGCTSLSHVSVPLVVPSVKLTSGSHQLFVSRHFPSHEDASLVDVALATSAAPTYFPIHSIGDAQYADGGLIANCPELVALNLACRAFSLDLQEIHVLSIGTASQPIARLKVRRTNRGLLYWGRRIIETTMAAQESLSVDLSRVVLRDRYHRIDRTPSAEQAKRLGLDSASKGATSTLRSLADDATQEALAKPGLRRLLNHDPRRG